MQDNIPNREHLGSSLNTLQLQFLVSCVLDFKNSTQFNLTAVGNYLCKSFIHLEYPNNILSCS